MKELKEAIDWARNARHLYAEDIRKYLPTLVHPAEKVLAVEGKGVLPEKQYCKAVTEKKWSCEKCGVPKYECVFLSRNAAIDEMAIRLASISKGVLPKRKEVPSLYGTNATVEEIERVGLMRRDASVFNSAVDEMAVRLAGNVDKEKDYEQEINRLENVIVSLRISANRLAGRVSVKEINDAIVDKAHNFIYGVLDSAQHKDMLMDIIYQASDAIFELIEGKREGGKG